MMTFLFRDHIIPQFSRSSGIPVEKTVLTDAWADQDEWSEIRFGSMKLGAMRTATEKEVLENYYLTTAHLEIDTPFIKGRIITSAKLNHRLEVESVKLRAHLPRPGEKLLTGEELSVDDLPSNVYEMVVKISGNQLEGRLRRDDAVQYFDQRLPRPVTMSDSLTPVFRGRMLKKDVVYTVDVYDPLWGSNSTPVKIEYVDDEVLENEQDKYYVKKVLLEYSSMETRLYIDSDGTVRKREIPLLQFAQNNPDSSREAATTLVIEYLDPQFARTRYPELNYLPAVPEITRKDVNGKDKGKVLQGLSAFSLLSNGLKSSITGN